MNGTNEAPQQQPALAIRTIAIRDAYITLGQLLKRAGFVNSGGEAKLFLAEAVIRVNGEPDNRRGRKLRPGDVVAVEEHEPIVLTQAEPQEDRSE